MGIDVPATKQTMLDRRSKSEPECQDAGVCLASEMGVYGQPWVPEMIKKTEMQRTALAARGKVRFK